MEMLLQCRRWGGEDEKAEEGRTDEMVIRRKNMDRLQWETALQAGRILPRA